jgi:hypothetical protein
MKHTPGPWKIYYSGQIGDADGRFVCGFRWDSYREFNNGNNAATARLIAAAPELLEALEACNEAMGYMSDYDIPVNLPAKVAAAIKRARGE